VHDVRQGAEADDQEVLVAIPRSAVADNSVIEEVRVIGQAPDKTEIELPEFETQWVDDYDKDYYGLLVRVKGGIAVPPFVPMRHMARCRRWIREWVLTGHILYRSTRRHRLQFRVKGVGPWLNPTFLLVEVS
jgi:hypothetical protein